ncbi:MAG: hypothetical protein IPN74_10400 [Haliscomenobacter sp.]|nr:hypothetical protein [Haliscomenobacter sp.]
MKRRVPAWLFNAHSSFKENCCSKVFGRQFFMMAKQAGKLPFSLLFFVLLLSSFNPVSLVAQATCETRFNFMEGQAQSFTVPNGVTSVTIRAVGGDGFYGGLELP